jgi:hypothetical protein
LAKPSEGAELDKSAAIHALLPSFIRVLEELKALGVPEVFRHKHRSLPGGLHNLLFKRDAHVIPCNDGDLRPME